MAAAASPATLPVMPASSQLRVSAPFPARRLPHDTLLKLIGEALARRAARRGALLSLGLLGGGAACLTGPALLAGLALSGRDGSAAPIGYGTVFVCLCLVTEPILFWWAWRSEPSTVYSDEQVSEEAAQYAHAAARFGGGGNGEIFLLLLFLWGPRCVISSGRALLKIYRLRATDLRLASEIVARLLAVDEAQEAASMAAADAQRPLVDALSYLELFDWIGRSADRRRLWLGSESRKFLTGQIGSGIG